MLCIAAGGSSPGDFVVAAEFAVAMTQGEADRGESPEPAIVTGAENQRLSAQDYRRMRAPCELNRLIRIRGRSEIGVEWRCGPLDARWNDVYVVESERVARVIVNVPLLITAPDGRRGH